MTQTIARLHAINAALMVASDGTYKYSDTERCDEDKAVLLEAFTWVYRILQKEKMDLLEKCVVEMDRTK